MIKFIIMIGQVDIIPHLGPGLHGKDQDDNNGQDPDIPFFALP